MSAPDGPEVFSEFTPSRPLLLVGCGRMGRALLAGWLEGGLDREAVKIIDPAIDPAAIDPMDTVLAALPRAAFFQKTGELPRDFAPRVTILAVKPQMMDAALAPLARLAATGTAFISIAAGKSLDYFASKLGAGTKVIRAMPNTPAAIGHGITAAVANENVTRDVELQAEALLSAVGDFVWLEEEKQIDAVTAVSGSGPAYIFYLAECLAAAGVANGLPKALSERLAVKTVTGAGALLAQSGDSPSHLREAVTSPAGTTAAALDVLTSENGMSMLMRKAVAAAVKRSRKLGN